MQTLRKLILLISNNKILSFMLGASFAVTVSYAFYYQIEPKVDARAYDVIAKNIVSGIGYREDLSVGVENDYAIARVGPLYQYFLAGIYKVFGHNYAAVWIIQAFLHSASAFLVYLVSLIIFDTHKEKKYIALLSSAIFAFHPDLIEIAAMLMTETLYLFFVCLLIYVFFLYINSQERATFIGLAVISGIAVLARPPLLFCLPIIMLFMWKAESWRKVLVYVVIVVAIFTPWTVRNYMIFEKIMPFGIAGNLNFWIGNHVGANGEQEASDELNALIADKQIKNLGDVSIREFKSFVFGNPIDFLGLSLMRINKYFSILRPMGFWFYSSGWKQVLFVISSAGYSFLILVLGIAGIAAAIKRYYQNENIRYLLLLTLATPIIIFFTVVETRYRFQVYPFLAMFTALSVSLFKTSRDLVIRLVFASFCLIALNGLVDLFVNFDHFRSMLSAYI